MSANELRNPLLILLKALIPDGGTISQSQVLSFINTALADADNYHNFDAASNYGDSAFRQCI